MTRHSWTTAALIALVGVGVVAQAPIEERIVLRSRQVPPINERIVTSPIQEGPGSFAPPPSVTATRIFGVVINELGTVVPSAGYVVLRSLSTGHVVAQTEVDTLGQFNIVGLPQGIYSAELVDKDGTLLTTSPSFTLSLGEVVQLTPVIDDDAIGGLATLLGRSTSGAVNAAVTAGLLAIRTPEPLSPQR